MKKTDNIIICGDCQLDSHGWSATKGAYTFMNFENKKLKSMEFGDKREVCFKLFLISVPILKWCLKFLCVFIW